MAGGNFCTAKSLDAHSDNLIRPSRGFISPSLTAARPPARRQTGARLSPALLSASGRRPNNHSDRAARAISSVIAAISAAPSWRRWNTMNSTSGSAGYCASGPSARRFGVSRLRLSGVTARAAAAAAARRLQMLGLTTAIRQSLPAAASAARAEGSPRRLRSASIEVAQAAITAWQAAGSRLHHRHDRCVVTRIGAARIRRPGDGGEIRRDRRHAADRRAGGRMACCSASTSAA
jgi:hypothetical protein